MFSERTSVGLDVHARSVVAAAIDGVTGEVFRARLTPGHEVLSCKSPGPRPRNDSAGLPRRTDPLVRSGAPSGTRTPNPLIKSQLLCQLS